MFAINIYTHHYRCTSCNLSSTNKKKHINVSLFSAANTNLLSIQGLLKQIFYINNCVGGYHTDIASCSFRFVCYYSHLLPAF